MQDIDYPPTATARLRPQLIVIALGIIIVALGAASMFEGFHARPPHSLSALEKTRIASQVATLQASAQPQDDWVESRDGDGALDVEDVNGPATIYFDRQSHTRLLCVENNGCYHLRGHYEGKK